jgi:ABC-2 type transport system ATP-binding protein
MPLISTRALTKRYPGGVTALDGLSLEIGDGVIGLVGANGAGKSTLIKILLGLLPATSGEAHVLDFDTATQGERIRELVGYMPEHDCLPPDVSATEFVTHMARVSGLPGGAARERTADVLRHVGLYEERYRQIGGYSTGMKQRVKLAQALVHDPAIAFLDEPTAGLDPGGRREMLELVARVGREFGIGIVVSTHLMGDVERVCDNVVVLEAGHVLRTGAVAAFTRETDTLVVEVVEGAAALAGALERRGLAPRVDGRVLTLEEAGGDDLDTLRDAIVESGALLYRLAPARLALSSVFAHSPPAAVSEEPAP